MTKLTKGNNKHTIAQQRNAIRMAFRWWVIVARDCMLVGCVHPVKMASAWFCQILCCVVSKKSWYLWRTANTLIRLLAFFFGLILCIPVNSYGNVGMVSSRKPHFFLGMLD